MAEFGRPDRHRQDVQNALILIWQENVIWSSRQTQTRCPECSDARPARPRMKAITKTQQWRTTRLHLAINNQNIHDAKHHIEKTSTKSIAQTSDLLLSRQLTPFAASLPLCPKRVQSASNNTRPSSISTEGAASG